MEQVRPAVEPSKRTPSADSTPLDILVIDDDDLTIDFVRTALDGRPVTVSGATDAASEPGSLFRRLKPGLVLLRSRFARGQTAWTCNSRSCVEEDPETQVFIMTGHYSTESAVRAIQAGADDYLNKPRVAEHLEERWWMVGSGEQAARQKAAQLEQERFSIRRYLRRESSVEPCRWWIC